MNAASRAALATIAVLGMAAAGTQAFARSHKPLAPVHEQIYPCAPSGSLFHRTAALRCCDLRFGCARFIDTTRAQLGRSAPRT